MCRHPLPVLLTCGLAYGPRRLQGALLERGVVRGCAVCSLGRGDSASFDRGLVHRTWFHEAAVAARKQSARRRSPTKLDRTRTSVGSSITVRSWTARGGSLDASGVSTQHRSRSRPGPACSACPSCLPFLLARSASRRRWPDAAGLVRTPITMCRWLHAVAQDGTPRWNAAAVGGGGLGRLLGRDVGGQRGVVDDRFGGST